VLVEQVTPVVISQRDRALRRTDDVGEQDRGEDPVQLRVVRGAREELLHAIEEDVGGPRRALKW
jgi:hypothetical protein